MPGQFEKTYLNTNKLVYTEQQSKQTKENLDTNTYKHKVTDNCKWTNIKKQIFAYRETNRKINTHPNFKKHINVWRNKNTNRYKQAETNTKTHVQKKI